MGSGWAWTHCTMAYVLQLAGNPEEAIKSASRASQMAPQDPEPLAIRARAYLALRRYRSAAEDLDRAVALDPGMAKELDKELLEVKNRRGD